MNRILSAAAGLAALIPGFAMADPNCLELSQIWSWKAVDNKTLIVEDNFHHKFKVSLMTYCPDLAFKENLGFQVFGGTGLSCVSKGDQVVDRDRPIGSYRCPISNIAAYTPEMEKADKAAAAAKAAQQNSGTP
ncbi:MAG: DUF6491 family protein [Rhizomicrobium sp.]|jgi:hypothetical protein